MKRSTYKQTCIIEITFDYQNLIQKKMDLREFFDSIFNMEETIDDLEKSFIRGNFMFGDGPRTNIRPRDLMLKNSASSSSTIRRSPRNGVHSFDNFFEALNDNQLGSSKSQTIIKEFKSDSQVMLFIIN